MRHKTTGPLAPNELLQRPCPRWAVGFVELARGEHRCSRMLRTLRGWRRRGLEKVQSDVLDHKSELAVFSCVVLCKRLGRGEPEAVGETSAPESDACVICGICGGAGDSRRSSSDEVGLLPPPSSRSTYQCAGRACVGHTQRASRQLRWLLPAAAAAVAPNWQSGK